jgi:hypothetical protein
MLIPPEFGVIKMAHLLFIYNQSLTLKKYQKQAIFGPIDPSSCGPTDFICAVTYYAFIIALHEIIINN